MSDISILFIGLIVGVVVTFWLYTYLKRRQQKQLTYDTGYYCLGVNHYSLKIIERECHPHTQHNNAKCQGKEKGRYDRLLHVELGWL